MANIFHRLFFVFRRPIFVFRSPNHLSAPHPPHPPPAPPVNMEIVNVKIENIVFSGTFHNCFNICNFDTTFPSATASKMTSEPSQVRIADVVGGKDSGPSATAAKMMLEPGKSSGKTSLFVDVVGLKYSGPSATAAKMMLEPEKSSGKTS